MFAPLFSENTAVQPGHRSATLCWLSGFRPHSSSDPLARATNFAITQGANYFNSVQAVK